MATLLPLWVCISRKLEAEAGAMIRIQALWLWTQCPTHKLNIYTLFKALVGAHGQNKAEVPGTNLWMFTFQLIKPGQSMHQLKIPSLPPTPPIVTNTPDGKKNTPCVGVHLFSSGVKACCHFHRRKTERFKSHAGICASHSAPLPLG